LVFGVGETHEHICFNRAVEHVGRLRVGGVHTARRIEPDFASYLDALAHACGTLDLLNCAEIPPMHQ
jgi:hypothetical protein